MIRQSDLSKLSNRLARETGGRRIPESVLERDYCIAWFLTALSKSKLKPLLVFKGGTALKRCYFNVPIARYPAEEGINLVSRERFN